MMIFLLDAGTISQHDNASITLLNPGMVMYTLRLVCILGLFSSPLFAQDRFSTSGKDWQLPIPKAKPLVWHEDWIKSVRSRPERSEKQEQAIEQMQLADSAKIEQQYQQAEAMYKKALQLDPQLAMASYQLACNYVLWGKKDEAKKAFDHAVDIGFSDYASAFDDQELGHIRRLPDFTEKMKTIRDRYLKVQPSLTGQPIAFKPLGKKPEKGWPVMFFLHGYGDTYLNYLKECQEWAKLGVLAIALPGSIPGMVDGFTWSVVSLKPTHSDIQACLQSPLLVDQVDQQRVALFGFSQGAGHAIGLLKTEPNSYCAVIALSPGGKPDNYTFPGKLNTNQPKRLYYIHGKEEPHAPFAAAYSRACNAAQWPFKLMVHPGGHHFPQDWDAKRPEAVKFTFE